MWILMSKVLGLSGSSVLNDFNKDLWEYLGMNVVIDQFLTFLSVSFWMLFYDPLLYYFSTDFIFLVSKILILF